MTSPGGVKYVFLVSSLLDHSKFNHHGVKKILILPFPSIILIESVLLSLRPTMIPQILFNILIAAATLCFASAFTNHPFRHAPLHHHPNVESSATVSLFSQQGDFEGVRLNKIFKATHSRRRADALIVSGRVTVNGESAAENPGQKVTGTDVVEVDGNILHWAEAVLERPIYDYIKYWKPLSVICTSDRRIRDNIVDAIEQSPSSERLPDRRIFPVGRLDKDTSGLIIMTSDGRVPNSVLRGAQKHPKTYKVKVHKPLTENALQSLRDGVVITTQAQRDGKRAEPLTARTLPCEARQLEDDVLEITIVEGRNRQVRKMLDGVGYDVLRLHRSSFMGMTLDGLESPGQWQRLSAKEQQEIEAAIQRATENAVDGGSNEQMSE
jgi:23S rRNA pseudouridine2604 synthase